MRIGKHKNGTPSTGCTVRNNLASALYVQSGPDMTADHNSVVDNPKSVFVDPARGDFRLRKGSPAIDAGSSELAPETDIVGTTRPQGDAVDLGAYEYPAD